MDSYNSLIEAFRLLDEKKRRNPGALTKTELGRWRMMRCQLEEALFQVSRDPSKDTRESLRVPLTLRVRYTIMGKMEERRISVLSEGGAMIITPNPLPVSTRFDLEILSSYASVGVKLAGEVMWSKPTGAMGERGMGVRFVDPSLEQKKVLWQLVDEAVRRCLLERRQQARIDTKLNVEIEHGGRMLKLQTQDLSVGGMFIATNEKFRKGDQHRFELKIPGGFPAIKGVAEVVHASARPSKTAKGGIGVRFVELKPSDKNVIESFITRRVLGETKPTKEDPRQYARLKRRFMLRMQSEGEVGSLDAQDISGGGAFLQSRDPPKLGSKVEISFVHPTSKRTISVTGDVVRVVNPDGDDPFAVPGVALEFQSLSSEDERALRQFLKDLMVIKSDRR